MRRKLRFLPAAILGAAHLVIHFTLPAADLILHAALAASLIYGAKNA